MPLQFEFICPLQNGLHARPASMLAELVGRYHSQVRLYNNRTGCSADAASVLELVSADVNLQDACRLTVSGVDESTAHAALADFITTTLPCCDEPLPCNPLTSASKVPMLLSGENMTVLTGTTICAGIGCGDAVIVSDATLPESLRHQIAGDPKIEHARFQAALNDVQSELSSQLVDASQPSERAIIEAHLAIVKDTALLASITKLIDDRGRTAAQSVLEAVQSFIAKMNLATSDYIRGRIVDLQDIGIQLLAHLGENVSGQSCSKITTPSVVVSADLAPRQLLSLDRAYLRGIILESAGATSHAAILARSFGIPTITGVDGARKLLVGQKVVVDATRGLAVFPVTEPAHRFYEREIERDIRRSELLSRSASAPAITLDWHRVEVAANISSDTQANDALAHGAEGVGLFRTEMIFTGRDSAPSEDEQFEIYRKAVEAMNGRPVIIRTLDVGGDKPLSYLNLPKESNPFLGCRGIRLYKKYSEMFRTQLRAIIRASAYGPIKIMAPMVSSFEEAEWFRLTVSEVQAELAAQGVDYDYSMPVGIMIEVPSTALIIDKLCEVVDFFSIGTNDLCQYYLAVDRGNPSVSAIYNERHPSFLRLLKMIVDKAHARDKWIGLCGEMAGNLDNLPILIGLGLDEISLSARIIPSVKSAITKLKQSDCFDMLCSAMSCDNVAEVDDALRRSIQENRDELINLNLIETEVDCRSKEEVIKRLTDLLYITGRTNNPDLVEEAIWARESVYSTGLGYGFAIPHCKTDSVSANSILVLKLSHPVEWKSLDNKPVEFVILLAIRESEQDNLHLRIFSQLARKLVDDDFRHSLIAAQDNEEILSRLVSELKLSHD